MKLTLSDLQKIKRFIQYVELCDKTYMKPQVMKEPAYYEGYDDAFYFFNQIYNELIIDSEI